MVQLSKATEVEVASNYVKTELGMLIEYELTAREMSLGQFASLSGVDKSTLFRLIKGMQSRVHETTLKRLAAVLNYSEEELRLRSRIPVVPIPERLRRHFAESTHASAAQNLDAAVMQKRISKMVFRLMEMLVEEPVVEERRVLVDVAIKLNRMQFQPLYDDNEREFVRHIEEAYPLDKHFGP